MANRLSTLTSSKTAMSNTSQFAFPQQSSLVKDYRLLLMIRNNIFAHSNAWRKGGWCKLFRSTDAYKYCLNIINAFSVKRDDFTMVKQVFLVKALCLEAKQKCLKAKHETGDPCIKPRSFSQPQIFFRQFCFHEIRWTDEML